MKKLITTPIYYVNDVPHIGHAYTTVIADTYARYYRLKGDEVFFITGTDEHGQKIQEAAAKRGKTPKAYADEISSKFRKIWDDFEISYDYFVRTTDENHCEAVQKVFNKMFEKGDIYKGNYEGNYCVSCESYFPQNQLKDGKYCPDCGKETRIIKEESYFFKLSAYEERLLKWYESPECILPLTKKNEVISFVKQGLKDLSITRTSFDWGVKLPENLNEPEHVVYVWLDALFSYLSPLGFMSDEKNLDFWKDGNRIHFVGKDILRFHAVFWPAFLMSLDMPLPTSVAAHGWWTRDGEKMSKSKGNVVNPREVADAYGLESFRYFMLREMSFGQDGDFSQKALIKRINSELSDDLGNLLSRTVGMSSKYSNFKIDSKDSKKFFSSEFEETKEHLNKAISYLESFSPSKYLEELWKILNLANASIAKYEPWKMMKNNEEDKALALVAMIANLLAKVSFLLSPAMPKTAKKISNVLGFEISKENYKKIIIDDEILDFVCQKTEPLFVKIEGDLMQDNKVEEKNKIEEPKVPQIKIDDFDKLQIKVGTILECSNIEGSDKLLKFIIDLGEEKPRQIISGIAKFYNPATLVGKQVCVLANLKPAKIFKHLSEGMILSASRFLENGEEELSLISPLSAVGNGSQIS